jgi:phthiodiolone/phenolphthiodiolone dimycocerosates ketoreductase
VTEEAIHSESQGYDVLWIPDHLVDIQPLFSIYDCWTMLAWIGAKTKTAKLGSGVTDVQRIHPAKTANIVATLDNLTNGRAVLGIGSGEIMNTEAYGIAFESAENRIQRTKEAIQVIKALWSSSVEEPADFNGRYYTLKKAHLDLRPVQKPSPPIYVGTFYSPRMVQVAGEVADGWYPAAYFDVDTFAKRVAVLKDAAESAGRRFEEEIDVMANVPTLIANRSDKVLMERVRNALKKRMVINRYFFKILGVEHLLQEIPRELEYQLLTPNGSSKDVLSKAVEGLSVPDEVVDRAIENAMAIGSADECVSSIERFIAAGATHVYFPDFMGSRENYEKISKEIIPRLRAPS